MSTRTMRPRLDIWMVLQVHTSAGSSLIDQALYYRFTPFPFSSDTIDTVRDYARWIHDDAFYHLCVPLLLPVTFVYITLNWFSMKMFKHNTS